jgi:hypothetical protein
MDGTMDHVDFSLQQHLRVLRGQVDARLDQLVPAADLAAAACTAPSVTACSPRANGCGRC